MSISRSILIAVALLSLPFAAKAGGGAFDLDTLLSAEILPGWRLAGGTHMAALHLHLAEGWKTYWRAPGEAGIPPEFDWTGSVNIASVTPHWPRPVIFKINDLTSIGYTDDLVLPLEIKPVMAGAPMTLVGQISIGVCHDICVPATLTLQSALPAAGASDARIQTALSRTPKSATQAGLTSVTCQVDLIADGLRLTATLMLPPFGGTELGVVELSDPTVWASSGKTVRNGGTLTIVSDLVPGTGSPFALDRSTVRLTVLGEDMAVDLTGCPAE